MEEIEAPKGYLLDGMQFQDESGEVQEGRYLTQIRPDGDAAVLTGGNAHKASDHVIRGDLELIKIADGTHKRLSKVPFKITSNTTGESHVIVTDENGYASTPQSGIRIRQIRIAERTWRMESGLEPIQREV